MLTEIKADWLEWIAPERFNDKDLLRIVTFFVFHSPCKELSSMSKTLEEYGWRSPWRKPFWLNRQLKEASSNSNLLFSAANCNEVETALKSSDLFYGFPSKPKQERIAFYDNKKNQFLSVFYHIRNSFAHCRLNMIEVDNECVFALEDGIHKNGKFEVRARMIIKKRTLLKWIEIIQNGEIFYN